jgi:hypothetical protein
MSVESIDRTTDQEIPCLSPIESTRPIKMSVWTVIGPYFEPVESISPPHTVYLIIFYNYHPPVFAQIFEVCLR